MYQSAPLNSCDYRREILVAINVVTYESKDQNEKWALNKMWNRGGKSRTPFLVTYNRKLSMTYKINKKYWNILQINIEFRETVQDNASVAYKGNKYLQKPVGNVFKTYVM